MEFWEIGNTVEDHKFIGVQSVVAFWKYALIDTRSPLFGCSRRTPTFVFNLSDNKFRKPICYKKAVTT
jgi:hypothetical protein